ncbi:hypothetical protein FNF27_04934 [Cafeteria roenbergensis]|uniref:Uncharacterized protein n=1 Tax=Cafeteria roenbergensis TaxID=33653 RepID=A0A5A8ECG2_CAFRO|nr:hypothetical protein FNF27_04934 [Cafeteria roenbergensis]
MLKPAVARFIGLLLAAGASSATPAPFLAADINPVGYSGNVQALEVFNGSLVFGGNDPMAGGATLDVISYHPTAGAVTEASNFATHASLPAFYLCEFNGRIFFPFLPRGSGFGLGVLDQDAKQATLAVAIGATTSPFPAFMTVFGERMFMGALGSDAQGRELWAVDAAMNPSLIHEFSTAVTMGGDPKYLTVFDNKLFMQANSLAMNKGVELFAYDGTEVSLAADINAGAANSNPAHMAVVAGVLYMSADGGNGNGQELYAYDGTNAPAMVADVNAGPDGSFPEWLVEFSSTLYFVATTPATGRELFRLDGSTAVLVADTVPGAGDGEFGKMAVLDGVLYMAAHTVKAGMELFRLASSGNAIALEHDVDSRAYSSIPELFTVYDEQLYFVADDGVHGSELWRYNTTHGAELAADIMPGPVSSEPYQLVPFHGSLLLAGKFPEAGIELLQFDSKASEVQLLADIKPGSGDSYPSNLCILGAHMYFLANSGAASAVYKYSEESGLALVPGFPKAVSGLVAMEGVMYFSGYHADAGMELWSYSEGGVPALCADIQPGASWSHVESLVPVDGKLFMLAALDPSSTTKLTPCRFDPLTEDLQCFSLSEYSSFTLLMSYQGSLLFEGRRDSKRGLFTLKSDGSAAVAEFLPQDLGDLQEIVVYDGTFFFTSRTVDSTVGMELFGLAEPHAVLDAHAIAHPIVVTHGIAYPIVDAHTIAHPIVDAHANRDLHCHADDHPFVNVHTVADFYPIQHPKPHIHANPIYHCIIHPEQHRHPLGHQ